MSFGQAISTGFSKYVVFRGRARRSEFWYWWLFYVILMVIAAILDNLLHLKIGGTQVETYGNQTYAYYSSIGILTTIVALALLLPCIAVSVRRLHDTGNSGWWWWLQLLNFLCGLGTIILIIAFYIRPSQEGENQYGPPPA